MTDRQNVEIDSNLASTQTCDPVKMEERSGYKKTKLGWIPEEWEITELGKIGKVISGLTYAPEDVDENGTLVLRSSNIQRESLSFIDNVFVNTENLKYSPVKQDDILICVRNGSKNLIGKNALITKEVEGVAVGAFMAVYRSKLNNYLIQYFKTDIYNKEIYKNLGATINSINGSNLKKFRVPLPPLPEQQKIATILSTWDNAISKQQQLIAAKQEFKKGLMQLLLTGKKRFEGFEGEWEEVKLGTVTTINPKAETLPDEFIYIDLESVKGGKLAKRNVILNKNAPSRAQRLLKSGDILFQTVRPYQRNNFFYEIEEFSVASSGYAQIRTKQNARYIYHLLHTDYFVNKVLARCTGTSFPAVSPTDLKKIKIRLPKIKEQQKIASVLSAADKEIGLLQSELVQLQDQKRGLMQVLLTGEKRVKN